MLINYHIHTGYTVDAEGSVDDFCAKAEKLGYSEICITNHQEFRAVTDKSYNYALKDKDWERCLKEIDGTRLKYPSLKIRKGVELGYEPEFKSKFVEFPNKYDFDYVLASLHAVRGLYRSGKLIEKYKDKRNATEAYKIYYNELADALSIGCFDSVGHFDGLKRHVASTPVSNYIEEVERCIKLIKEKNLCVELNTDGSRVRTGECYPSPEILKIMYKAGIRKVTIGSDCHTPEDFDHGIEKGMKVLKDIGFKEICTFEKRKAIFHKI
jgi:histidinol-phosphatase (PHP family)